MLQPLNLAERRTIVERYARLLASVGAEVGQRPLVLPNGDSFPDQFTPDAAGLETLVACMLRHAGLEDVPLTSQVVEDSSGEEGHGGCSTGCKVPSTAADGAVPRLVDDGTRWTLNVPEMELGHPVVLTTMVARALGHVLLVEALPAGALVEPPVSLTADYAAVALGFGPLLLEGAYVYSKGCGGPQVGRVTQASLEELAFTTALFVEVGRHSGRRALGAVGVTQQAALREELEWARSNEALVKRLRDEPDRVAAGDYVLGEPRPWLVRLLGGRQKARAPDAPLFVAPKVRTPAVVDPAHAELRALVDEALGASPVDAE